MNTYAESYDEFIGTANQPLTHISNITNIGFGLSNGKYTRPIKTCSKHNNADIQNIESIVEWSKSVKSYALSIWATTIPPSWYESLKLYLKN